MHQPLAHLYFLTVLECLTASQTKLSMLVRTARTIQQVYVHVVLHRYMHVHVHGTDSDRV